MAKAEAPCPVWGAASWAVIPEHRAIRGFSSPVHPDSIRYILEEMQMGLF